MNKFPRIAEDKSQLEQFSQAVQAGDLGGKPVTLSGNSLVIPEQEQPQPVATIDGVEYFHKQEFNLEEMTDGYFDALTGIYNTSTDKLPIVYCNTNAAGQGKKIVQLLLRIQYGPTGFTVFSSDASFQPVDFTSLAFTVVDTQEEVTDNTKICLPTCSAYYGFLSEDGKTFISYYNLKSDGAPSYVDSVKQGNAVIPMRDSRVDIKEPTILDLTHTDRSTTLYDLASVIEDKPIGYYKILYTVYGYGPTYNVTCTCFAQSLTPAGAIRTLLLQNVYNDDGRLRILYYYNDDIHEIEDVALHQVLGAPDAEAVDSEYSIQLPSNGGTKLYKHTFANIQTTPFSRDFEVVNTRAEPYTGNAYAGVLRTLGVVDFNQSIAITSDKLYYGLSVANDVVSFASSITLSSEQISDTVTEL